VIKGVNIATSLTTLIMRPFMEKGGVSKKTNWKKTLVLWMLIELL